VYARLNQTRLKLEVISAGHPPALIVRAGGAVLEMRQPGDVLGLFDTAIFDTQSQDLRPGDRVFLFSDGLVEQIPGENGSRRKGLAALAQLAAETYPMPRDEVLQVMMKKLVPQKSSLNDDVVALIIELSS